MKSRSENIESIWNKKISAMHAYIAFAGLLLFIVWQFIRMQSFNKLPSPVAAVHQSCPPLDVIRYTMKEYKYARPVLVADVLNQGDLDNNSMGGIKNGITNIIETKKKAGLLTNVSVYLKQLKTGNYIAINDEERYHPASMSKVPVMMVIMRESELKPGLLEKQLMFEKPQEDQREQYYPPADAVKPGVKYSVRDLIYHSIVKSDNLADMVLTSTMNMDLWNKLFADLELPDPDLSNINYTLSASEYSRFMRILYNARYLTNEHADYALSLLAQTDFKDGMMKGLPGNVEVAHKFGEFGDARQAERELHESGILYIDNNPVLITIMTKGNNRAELPKVIRDITKYVYDQMKPAGS